MNANSHHFHGYIDLLEGRQGRGEPDIAIARVLAIREGGTGCGKLHASLGSQAHCFPGTAVQDIQADKIATGRIAPGGDPLTFQLSAKDLNK